MEWKDRKEMKMKRINKNGHDYLFDHKIPVTGIYEIISFYSSKFVGEILINSRETGMFYIFEHFCDSVR